MTGLSIFSPSPDHPPSPYQLWKRMARQMIELLPNDGATILVITHERGRLLKEGILELRGAALARKCKMMSFRGYGDFAKTTGLRGPVFVDFDLAMHFKPELYRRLELEVSGIRLHPERGTGKGVKS